MNHFYDKFNADIRSIKSKEDFYKLMSNLTNSILDYSVPNDESTVTNLTELDKYIENIGNLINKQKRYIEEDKDNENSLICNDKKDEKSIYVKYQEMKRKKLLILKGKNNKVEENNFIQDKSNSLLYSKFKNLKK